ncbi:hypothetical protein NS184_16810 [Curtobacterium luteum]|uniref:Uncharacterized protein n=2 Tax=Curtobacterium luteum TaxID=33881 RepID=A0A175RHA9_9MICO|nr:hypothetical protein NS184_16810 [Curtobacterium luteum]
MTSFDSDAHLIVGTAGNPDLLDAIDAFLERVTVNLRENWAEMYARRIAAAIIAADERMQQ